MHEWFVKPIGNLNLLHFAFYQNQKVEKIKDSNELKLISTTSLNYLQFIELWWGWLKIEWPNLLSSFCRTSYNSILTFCNLSRKNN